MKRSFVKKAEQYSIQKAKVTEKALNDNKKIISVPYTNITSSFKVLPNEEIWMKRSLVTERKASTV